MFKFVLAFIVWLFATGNYKAWAALVTTSAAPPAATPSASSNAGATQAQTGLGSAGTNVLNALSGVMGTGSENTGASSTSTPQDLIAGYSNGN
jgi:hypothetical protein